MDEDLRDMLVERIENVCHDLAEKRAPFAIEDAAKQVIDDLKADDNKRWRELRDHLAQEGVMKYVNRVIAQAKAADPAQRQLPGLESMPLLITSEGAAILAEQLNYEKYRAEVARLEKRINSYNYKRRKPEHLEQDNRQLEEMKRFDPRFAKYSRTNPDLTLAEAKQLEATKPAEPPKRRRRRGKE
jgi:hypothetical protein